jgi:Fic family protein
LLQLIESGLLDHPVLNISAFLEANKTRYRDLMLGVSRTGDFSSWVAFVADAIRSEAATGVARIARLVELQERMHQQIRQAKIKGLARDVADDLIANPIVTAARLRDTHNVSWPTADHALKRLQELGIISEATGSNYGKIYVADEVFQVINAD